MSSTGPSADHGDGHSSNLTSGGEGGDRDVDDESTTPAEGRDGTDGTDGSPVGSADGEDGDEAEDVEAGSEWNDGVGEGGDGEDAEPSEDQPGGGTAAAGTTVTSGPDDRGPGPQPADRPAPAGPVADPPGRPAALPQVPSWLRRPRPGFGRRPPAAGRVVKARLRHVDPWSVLKIAAIFYTCVAVVVLAATGLLWGMARSTGTIEDAESFVTELFTYGNCVAEDEVELGADFRDDDSCPEGHVMVGGFELDGGVLFRAELLIGAVFIVGATAGTVVVVLLFNLLTDLTGGIRYTVLREPPGTATSPDRSTGRPGER